MSKKDCRVVRGKIGIKYCGGCNPNYERVEMVQRFLLLTQDRFTFLRYDQTDLDALILVSGCSRACASVDLNQSRIPYCSVTSEGELETLVDWLAALDGEGDFK